MPSPRSPRTDPPKGTKLLYSAQLGPQLAAMESKAEEILYGGAAGGGKSYWLRMFLVNYCMQYPGARVVLFRRTFKELEDTHISMLLQEVPSWVAKYAVGSHEFRFENGSVLMLRFCEHEEDVYTYDTFECDVMAFDELTAFSEFQYAYLSTRCRSAKSWWPGRKILSASNPGNVGHEWVKRRFINYLKPYEIKPGPDEEGGYQRQFIPAKVSDNPILMRYNPDYVKTLQSLIGAGHEELYRAKALGDWNVFTGQFFSRWRDSVHVVPFFTPPAEWLRYISVDWGIAAPRAIYWIARPPSTQTCYVYREQYGPALATIEQSRQARDITLAAQEKIEWCVLDPAMWAREKDVHGELMRSNASYWQEDFRGMCEIVKGNNERVQGAATFRAALDWVGVETEHGIQVIQPPKLMFMDSCPNAIRTIPNLVHSKTNVEDVDTLGEDHSYDSLRYFTRGVYQGPIQPRQNRVIIDNKGRIVVLPM